MTKRRRRTKTVRERGTTGRHAVGKALKENPNHSVEDVKHVRGKEFEIKLRR